MTTPNEEVIPVTITESRPISKYHILKPPLTSFHDDSLSPAQKAVWRRFRDQGEFVEATTRRQQIGIAVKKLSIEEPKESRFTHEKLATIFDMSRSDLEKQYNKFIHGTKDIGAPSILSPHEKLQLVQWINEQIAQQEYPTVDMISDFVSVVLKKDMLQNTLRKFLETKLPAYKFVEALPLEDVRYNVRCEDIDAYYNVLEEKISQADFRFFFNIDETGEDEFVDTHAVKVFVPVSANPDSIKIPVSRKQKRFTIVHTICTDGTYMDMYLVLPRVTIESDIFTIIDSEKIRMVYQKNGFVTDAIFKDFWENWFIKQLREKRKLHDYVGLSIVIMDNHPSHHKVVGGDPSEKVTFVEAENLLIIWLVPHSSEQTQPLDLGVFSVQKRETQKQKKDKEYTNYTNMIMRALSGMQKACTYKTVIGAFKAAGIVRVLDAANHSILKIDRTKAHSVRHWESFQEERTVEGTRRVSLINHNPEFPRFKILAFTNK